MPNITEYQNLEQNQMMRDNDQESRYLMGFLLSRKTPAVGIESITTDAQTMRSAANPVVLFSPSAAINYYLQRANYWVNKSPIMVFVNTSTLYNVTLNPAAGSSDTLNGAATYVITPGAIVIGVCDASSKWYFK